MMIMQLACAACVSALTSEARLTLPSRMASAKAPKAPSPDASVGVATPTEASGLGAFGAFALAIREGKVNRASLVKALTHAAHASCMIIMIVVCAKIFGYFF